MNPRNAPLGDIETERRGSPPPEPSSPAAGRPESVSRPAALSSIDGVISSALLAGFVVIAFAVAMTTVRSAHPSKPPVVDLSPSPSRAIPAKRDMVMISGGSYRMRPDAGVPPSVVLAPFYIDRYETTNAAYAEFWRKTGHSLPLGLASGYLDENPRLPVWDISARDAEEYCASQGKRLPKEVEWLVAAGGPGAYLYPWGEDSAGGQANVGSDDLLPVGSSPGDVSPFGVYDMAGNLPEYVRNGGNGMRYLVRGGGYYLPKDFARLTLHFAFPEELEHSRGYARIGFRCACEGGPLEQALVRYSPSMQ